MSGHVMPMLAVREPFDSAEYLFEVKWNGIRAFASQLGPDAQAGIVDLNKNAGLSHGKIVRTLNNLFGISLTRGGSVHAVLRAGRRCAPIYQAICRSVRQSPWVVPDETGWRVGGLSAWLHGFQGHVSGRRLGLYRYGQLRPPQPGA